MIGYPLTRAHQPAPILRPDKRRWLGALYESNYTSVLRLCVRVLRNADDAADAAQEVFLSAAESLPADTNSAQARAWLRTVARNRCLDLLRRRKRLGRALVTLEADARCVQDLEAVVVDRSLADAVFRRLTLRERTALWQAAVEQRPLADIAAGLRLSYAAAAQVLHRARRHASQVAARIAILLGALSLGQRVRGRLIGLHQLAAAAAVPLIVAGLQPSDSPRSGAASPAAVAGTAVQRLPGAPARGSAPAGVLGVRVSDRARTAPLTVTAPLPVDPRATVQDLANQAGAVGRRLPGVLPTPLPVPAPPLPAPPQPSFPPVP